VTTTARRTFLLTGVTGFLGKVLLEELLRRREELGIERVLVVIRPLRGLAADERFARDVVRSPCFAQLAPGWDRWVTVLEADLELPQLPASLTSHPALQSVTHVVHAAASIQFNLPLALAARANVHATLGVLALARSLPRSERFVYVSTAYVSPHRAGEPIWEALVALPAPAAELFATCQSSAGNNGDGAALLRRTGHPNTYTFTKAIAEHLVVERRGQLPVTIVRPSIVAPSRHHPFPGWIDSAAGVAGLVMYAGTGYLRAFVCDPAARLDLIPVDDVTREIVRASVSDTGGADVRHVVAGAARAPTMAQTWDATRRYFTENPAGPRRLTVYLGPRGVRFWLTDLVQHRLPIALSGLRSPARRRQGQKALARLASLNEEFVYFTTRTFDFQTSTPLDLAFDGVAFVETIARGVHRHLLARRGTR
jgi:nucleoside-diphosphate-sugar epimerase